jgi:cytochrome P450
MPSPTPGAVAVRPAWRALLRSLKGDALAVFPQEAFEEEVIVSRFLGRFQFILNRPQAIRRVLIENPGNYARPAPTTRVLRPIFGRGLFLATGEEWDKERRMMAPAFAPRAVAILARHVALAAERLICDLRSRKGELVDLVPRLQRLALDIIGRAMFSLEMERYGGELRALIMRYAGRLGRPTLFDMLLPLRLPSPRDLSRQGFRREWKRLIGHIVEERLGHLGDGEPRDLFDLLAGSGGEADLDRLGDQVSTILVAGHETTAAALFWSFYLLARAPEEQERLALEGAAADLAPERAASALPGLVRTRAVVDEALRLYPPAFVIVREAKRADVADGIAIPGGSLVLIAPFVLHRHRRLWENPEAFDPARFLSGGAPRRFHYLPFGAGPRVCIGAPFALTELVLVLSLFVRAFRIEIPPGTIVRAKAIVTTQPLNPPPFRLRPRGQTSATAGAFLPETTRSRARISTG